VLTYQFSHQLVHRNLRWRLPKELCVALLLGAGAALFPILRASSSLWPLAPPLALFILLCFLNCVLISSWECAVDEMQGQTSIALQFRQGAAFGAVLPWVLAALAVAVAGFNPGGRATVAAGCALASSLSLGIVNRAEARLGRQLARVLADAVLMTPIVPLLWAWLE